MRIWMVRAGEDSYLIDEFLQDNIIAIGWNDLGQLNVDFRYQDLKNHFKATYPDDSDGRVNQCVGQIWRFLWDFSIGDKVVTYDRSSRLYYLGTITSDYKFDASKEYHHYREIEWLQEGTPRDLISAEVKNSLGAISTIFELSQKVWDELVAKNPITLESISEEAIQEMEEAMEAFETQKLRDLKDDIISRSKEFTKDIISNLTWQDVEVLVAGLLKTMGYKTRLTSSGSDLGSDIIASPDDLFLEQPLIKVEIKKWTKDKIGAPEIRNFIGGMRGHHKGIFVSISGFTKEARYEAERANFAITLIDSDWLVELLVANYENLEPEIKSLVPLRKIYWPV